MTTTTTTTTATASSRSNNSNDMAGSQLCGSSDTTNKKLHVPLLPPSRPCKKRDAHSQQQQQEHLHHAWEDRRVLHHDGEIDGESNQPMDETTTHPPAPQQRLENEGNSSTSDSHDEDDAQNASFSSILFSDNGSSSASSALSAVDENDQHVRMAAQSVRQVAFDLPKNAGMSSMPPGDMDHVSSNDISGSNSSGRSSTHVHPQPHHQAKRRRGGTPHRKAPPPSTAAGLGEEEEHTMENQQRHHHHHRRNNTCASSIILSFDVSADEVRESGAIAAIYNDVDSPRWDTVREIKNPTQQQQEYWDLLYGHDAKRLSVSASYSAQRTKPPKGCLSAVKPSAIIQHEDGKQQRSLLRNSFCSGETYRMIHSPMASSPSTGQYLTPKHSPDDVIVLEPTIKDTATSDKENALINSNTGSRHSIGGSMHHHRSVQFGFTTAVEYKSDDPVAKSLTPMPNDKAAALYPIDGSRTSAAEETLIQETKDNAALLAAWDVDDSDDENDNNQMTTSSMFAVDNNDDDDTDRPYFVATRLLHRPRRTSAFFSPAEGSRNLLGEETNTNHNKYNSRYTGIDKHQYAADTNLESLSSLSVHTPPLLVDQNGQSCVNVMQAKCTPIVHQNNHDKNTSDTQSSSSSVISVTAEECLSVAAAMDETITLPAVSKQHETTSDNSDDGSLSYHVQMQQLDSSSLERSHTCCRLRSRKRSSNDDAERPDEQEEDDFPDMFTVLTHLANNWYGESSSDDEPLCQDEPPNEKSWLQTFASSDRRILRLCLEAAIEQMEEFLADDKQVLNSNHNSHQHASLEFETSMLGIVYENLIGSIDHDRQASLAHVRSLSIECDFSNMTTKEKHTAASQVKELEAAICAQEWRKECLLYCKMQYELQRRPLAEWRLQATAGMVQFGVEGIDDEEVRLLFSTLHPDCSVRVVADANGDLCQINVDSSLSTTISKTPVIGGSRFKVAREMYYALLAAKSKSLLESGDFDDVSDVAIELSVFLTRLNLITTSLVRVLHNGGACVLTPVESLPGESPAGLSLVVTLPDTANRVQLDYYIHNDPRCLVWALPSQVTYLHDKSLKGNLEKTVVLVENHQYNLSQICHAEVCATLFDRLSATS